MLFINPNFLIFIFSFVSLLLIWKFILSYYYSNKLKKSSEIEFKNISGSGTSKGENFNFSFSLDWYNIYIINDMICLVPKITMNPFGGNFLSNKRYYNDHETIIIDRIYMSKFNDLMIEFYAQDALSILRNDTFTELTIGGLNKEQKNIIKNFIELHCS